MSRCRHDHGRRDSVRVHATLGVMVQSHQSPVGNDAGDAGRCGMIFADDEVLDGGGVHENDVGHHEDAREDGRSEEGGMAYDDECAFIFEGDTELREEAVSGLADDLQWTRRVSEPEVISSCVEYVRTIGVMS